MGLGKWFVRFGAVGGIARWAIKNYQNLRTQFPDHSKVSDVEIYNMMVGMRYSTLPGDKKCIAFFEGYMNSGSPGLKGFIAGVIRAENRSLESAPFPSLFFEVIDEELAKSGLPDSVINRPSKRI
jgi:hypothetical protein